jgi:hypothetical protein
VQRGQSTAWSGPGLDCAVTVVPSAHNRVTGAGSAPQFGHHKVGPGQGGRACSSPHLAGFVRVPRAQLWTRCRADHPHSGSRSRHARRDRRQRACVRLEADGRTQRPAAGNDPPNYPIADAIASQNTVKSPPNGCGPCSITCSLRKFPWASNVATIERNPTSFTNVLLCEV